MRRRLAVAAAIAVTIPFWAGSGPALASGPVKDGWWSEANLGLGVNPIPPDVPDGGLYVANGFSGPVAYSALTFDVPAGAAVGPLVLQITGTPIITSPPLVCPLESGATGYQAVQSGPWSDRPAYDCARAEISGSVSSGDKTVSFTVDSLLANGRVAVAVLAGGHADQIAFAKPGTDTLSVTPVGSSETSPPSTSLSVSPGAATTATGPPTAPAPSAYRSTSAPGTPVSAGSFPTASAATSAVTPNAASGTSPDIASTPATGSPVGPTTRAGSAPTSHAVAAGATSPRPSGSGGNSSHTAGEIVGGIGLIGLLVAFSEGYGILGGKVRRRARSQPTVANLSVDP